MDGVAVRKQPGEGGSGNGAAPLLEVCSLTKRYGHVMALEDVSFELQAAEVLAVVGDNGAGKSTLVSLLSGVAQPDQGIVRLDGIPVVLSSAARAQALGIATVFQNLALVDQRHVAANLFLGQEPTRLGFVLGVQMLREAERSLEQLRVAVAHVHARVGDLSGGQRQAIAVARAVMRGSRILLMDEPTAALGVREAGRVLDLIRELRSQQQAIVLVSHNLENVFDVADRLIVLRLGKKVLDCRTAEIGRDDVVALITGGRSGMAG